MTSSYRPGTGYSRQEYRKHMARERRKLARAWQLRSGSFDGFLATVEAAIGHPPTLLHKVAVVIATPSDLSDDFEPTFERIAWWSVRGGWTCGRPLGDQGARCAEVFRLDAELVRHRGDKHGD